jgi:hypothetical protein
MIASDETLPSAMGSAKRAWIAVLALLLAAFASFLLVPWTPQMPAAGLDASWEYALNEAVARHFVFGRNFVYTEGPLGSVYTTLYGPATDALMLAGSGLLALALCAGVATLAWPRNLYVLFFLPIVVAEPVLRDAFLMAPPLLLLLVIFRLCSAPESRHHLPVGSGAVLCVLMLSCALGILPLIKGTVLTLAVVEGGLAVLIAVVGRRSMLGLGISVLAVISLCVGWAAAGQPLMALPHFFWAQEPIIAGYSEAMSLHGPLSEVLYWAGATVVISAILYTFITRRHGLAGRLVLFGFAVYFFVTFKEGFVRQLGHPLIPAEAFLFIGLFLGAMLELWPAVAVGLVACFAWGSIEHSVGDFNVGTLFARVENAVQGAVNGALLHISSPDALPAAFNQATAAIRAASPLPRVTGAVDLYPYDLSLLFADGMKWDPRPIIQSHAAYTPTLGAKNAAHLSGNDAPENIFFAVDPIDQRLPALEDAASWPLLLSKYSILGFHGNYLHMVRFAHPTAMHFDRPSAAAMARIGEWVNVPWGGELVWASIDMRPTILGRLVLAAFKLPRVWIEAKLADSRTVQNRYIPEMGQGGFLLSPYVGSTADFAMTAAGSDKGLDVRQIRLVTPVVGLWTRRIGFSFRVLDIPRQREVRRLVLMEPNSPPAFVSARTIDRIEDCSLDTINGRLFASLSDPILVHDDTVNVSGWTAPSGRRGIGPDETWISLTSANGERKFYRARPTERPDVLAFFKQPEMKRPGFLADLDFSGLSGTQTLTIYSEHGHEAFRCPQRVVLTVGSAKLRPAGSIGK